MILNNKLLLGMTLIVVGNIGLNDKGIAATFNPSQGIFELNNFSHVPYELSTFESAFAYVATEEDFAITKSDPVFITGHSNLIFHPLAPIVSPILSSYHLSSQSQGKLITAPFSFESVSGSASGENHVNYDYPHTNHLNSVTLTSSSQLTVSESNHSVWTVGQSGFQGSFRLADNETFSFTLNSSLPSSSLENLKRNPSQQFELEQSQVIYFWAKPKDLDTTNLILMFPLYPQISIAVNDDRVEAGLLGIKQSVTSQSSDSLQVGQNSISPDNSSYFQPKPNSARSDVSEWHFEYRANQPIDLTVVAYTSSDLISTQIDNSTEETANRDPQNVPESLGVIPILLVGLGIFFLNK